MDCGEKASTCIAAGSLFFGMICCMCIMSMAVYVRCTEGTSVAPVTMTMPLAAAVAVVGFHPPPQEDEDPV
jgi:hypothetical protein